ncbi:hypothetical protein Tco_0705215, partial [Tanacetum coccineum]
MVGEDAKNPPPPPPVVTPTQQAPHTMSTIKLSILKKGEYDIWAMKMEHYLAHTDDLIWEVIQRGNGHIWDAIKSRFGGNDESKKMQKYILKQQFECFSVSNSEGLHKGYDRFQSLLSQLEIHGADPRVDSLCFDDMYNNLRVFESNVKGSTRSKALLDHLLIIKKKDNGKETWKAEEPKSLVTLDGQGVDIDWSCKRKRKRTLLYGLQQFSSSCSKEYEESYAKLKNYMMNKENNLEKIRFIKIDLDDKTDVLTYHKKLLAEAVKEKEELKTRLEKWQNSSKGLNKLLYSHMSVKDKIGLGFREQVKENDLYDETLMSVFDSHSSDIKDAHVYDRFAKDKRMHAVPPPMTGNYILINPYTILRIRIRVNHIPSGPDREIDDSMFTYGPKQSNTSESDAKTSDFDSCVSNSSVETLESVPKPVVIKPKVVSQPKVWSDAPIIEEYESDNEDEYVVKHSKEQEQPSFAFVNTVKHVKYSNAHQIIQASNSLEKNMLKSVNIKVGEFI